VRLNFGPFLSVQPNKNDSHGIWRGPKLGALVLQSWRGPLPRWMFRDVECTVDAFSSAVHADARATANVHAVTRRYLNLAEDDVELVCHLGPLIREEASNRTLIQ